MKKYKIQLSSNPKIVATFRVSHARLKETLRILNLDTEQQFTTFVEKWAQIEVCAGQDLKFLKFRIEQQTECYLSCSLSEYIDAYMHLLDSNKEVRLTEEMQSALSFVKKNGKNVPNLRIVR